MLYKLRKNIYKLNDSWLGMPGKLYEFLSIEYGYAYTRKNGERFYG